MTEWSLSSEARSIITITAYNHVDTQLIKDESIVKYLLGELPASEEEDICLALYDDSFFERVMVVEQELIDNYVRGRLSTIDQKRFREKLLNNPRQSREVELSRGFFSAISEFKEEQGRAPVVEPAPKRSLPWWQSLLGFFQVLSFSPRFALAAASLLVFLFSSWMLLEALRIKDQFSDNRAEVARLEKSNQELAAHNEAQKKQFDQELHSVQTQVKQTEEELRRIKENNSDLAKKLKGLESAQKLSYLSQQIADERQQNSRLANEIAQLRSRTAPQITPSPSVTAPGFVTLLLERVINFKSVFPRRSLTSE